MILADCPDHGPALGLAFGRRGIKHGERGIKQPPDQALSCAQALPRFPAFAGWA